MPSSMPQGPRPGVDTPRINEQIRISPLRVIDANGEQLGIITREEAMELAREQNLDLVEVAANVRPPVCKIMDYGKFKYEQTKKSKVKTHRQQEKEIRLRPQVGDADLEVKTRHAREFLEEKHKVRIVCQFKGREIIHSEGGMDKIRALVDALTDIAKVEREPRREGKRIIALLAPK